MLRALLLVAGVVAATATPAHAGPLDEVSACIDPEEPPFVTVILGPSCAGGLAERVHDTAECILEGKFPCVCFDDRCIEYHWP